MDARIVCVLHWSDSAVDTVTFGKMYQTYNRRCYQADSVLLGRLSTYLPDRHRAEIDHFIRVDLPGAGWSDEDFAK